MGLVRRAASGTNDAGWRPRQARVGAAFREWHLVFDGSSGARRAPGFGGLARRSSVGAASLLVVASSASAWAAEVSSATAKPRQPRQREAREAADEKRFLIRPFIAMDQLSLDVTRGDTTLAFVPNTQLALGLRLGYSGFSVSASVDIEASEDEAVYGKSDYLALQAGRGFRVAGRELFISGFLQYHEGLYLESSSDIAPGSGPLVFPEMTLVSLGVNASYYSNPEFSFDDTFVEFRPRAHTVGSWTLRLSTGLMGFDNADQPVIPEQRRASFGDQAGLTASAALYLGAMGGYTIDVRFFDSWCLAGSLLLGATLAREYHETDRGAERGVTLGPAALVALAFGYSGETFHAGIFAHADAEAYKAGPVEQDITRIAVAAFAGVRF
jgi:uncharacterized protein DUF4421